MIKTYKNFLNEAKNVNRITKASLANVINGITININRDNLMNDKDTVMRSFMLLNSYLVTMGMTEEGEKQRVNKMSKLYNDIFANDLGKDTSAYTEKMDYLAKIALRGSKAATKFGRWGKLKEDSVNEYDDASYDTEYFVKELTRDLIGGGAAVGVLMATGSIGLAAATIIVPAVIHSAIAELDKRDMFLSHDKCDDILNKFRTTIDDMSSKLADEISDVEYTNEQIDTIMADVADINKWFSSKSLYGIEHNLSRQDAEVTTFLNSYVDNVKDIASSISKDENGNVSIDNIIKLVEDAKASIETNMPNYKTATAKENSKEYMQAKEACLKALSVIVFVTSTLDEDENFKELDAYAEELYNIMFSEFNERGTMTRRTASKITYADLKAFFDSNRSLINAAASEAMASNEGALYEDEESASKALKIGEKFWGKAKKVKDSAATTGWATFQKVLFDLSFSAKLALVTKNISVGVSNFFSRTVYALAEVLIDPIFDKFFSNYKVKSVTDKMVEVINKILSFLKAKKDEIEANVEVPEVVETSEGMKYVMTRAEFLNESEVNEGIGSKILTGAALIASLLGGPKTVRAGGFRDAIKDGYTSLTGSIKANYGVTARFTVGKSSSEKDAKAKLIVNANDVAINYGYWAVTFKPGATGELRTIDMSQGLTCPEIQSKQVDTNNGVVFIKASDSECQFKFDQAEKLMAKVKLGNPEVVEGDTIAFDVIAGN